VFQGRTRLAFTLTHPGWRIPQRMLAASAFAPQIPDALRRLVRSTIDPDPDRRPTAPELLRSLRGLKCVDWIREGGDV
jgi:hypothetical protein